MPYDPVRDLIAITQTSAQSMLVVLHPSVPINTIHAEVVKILNTPDVRDKLIAAGSEPVGNTPEAFSAYVKSELARWGRIIRENNIRGE